MPQTNPRWQMAAILKKMENAISSQWIDQFFVNFFGRGCVMALWTLSANKILSI